MNQLSQLGKILTAKEISERLGVSELTVRRWRRIGLHHGQVRLKEVRIGGKVRVREEDLEEFLAACTEARAAAPAPHPAVVSSRERQRQHEAAEHRLRERFAQSGKQQ